MPGSLRDDPETTAESTTPIGTRLFLLGTVVVVVLVLIAVQGVIRDLLG